MACFDQCASVRETRTGTGSDRGRRPLVSLPSAYWRANETLGLVETREHSPEPSCKHTLHVSGSRSEEEAVSGGPQRASICGCNPSSGRFGNGARAHAPLRLRNTEFDARAFLLAEPRSPSRTLRHRNAWSRANRFNRSGIVVIVFYGAG